MAVALDWGLIVPVIKNADEKSILGLARATQDLAERARSKRLKPEEIQGGTFTVTNPGVFGSLFGTPIIPQPQVAILGVGTIEKRPVVVTDENGQRRARHPHRRLPRALVRPPPDRRRRRRPVHGHREEDAREGRVRSRVSASAPLDPVPAARRGGRRQPSSRSRSRRGSPRSSRGRASTRCGFGDGRAYLFAARELVADRPLSGSHGAASTSARRAIPSSSPRRRSGPIPSGSRDREGGERRRWARSPRCSSRLFRRGSSAAAASPLATGRRRRDPPGLRLALHRRSRASRSSCFSCSARGLPAARGRPIALPRTSRVAPATSSLSPR